jgi:hypothetical protein
VNFTFYVGLCAIRTCSQHKQTERYSCSCPLSQNVKFLTEQSTKKSAKKLIKKVSDLFSANPGVPFYCVPEHRSYHDMPRWMEDFFVIKLSCSGTRWTGRDGTPMELASLF